MLHTLTIIGYNIDSNISNNNTGNSTGINSTSPNGNTNSCNSNTISCTSDSSNNTSNSNKSSIIISSCITVMYSLHRLYRTQTGTHTQPPHAANGRV